MLPGQALGRRLLFPSSGGHPHVSATALAAFHARPKGWHLNIVRVVVNADNCFVPASVVQARARKSSHPELAHIAERHGWAVGLLGFHSNERAFAGEDKLFDVRERLQVYDLEEREMSFRRGRR